MENKVMSIAATLNEGVDNKYEFSLIKCNKGGYITIRGGDVGAHQSIDEALDFLQKDIKTFMNEPLTTPPELPRPAPSVQQVHAHLASFDRLTSNRRPTMAAAVAHTGRRWTNGDILGMALVTILLVILSYQGFLRWWPDLL